MLMLTSFHIGCRAGSTLSPFLAAFLACLWFLLQFYLLKACVCQYWIYRLGLFHTDGILGGLKLVDKIFFCLFIPFDFVFVIFYSFVTIIFDLNVYGRTIKGQQSCNLMTCFIASVGFSASIWPRKKSRTGKKVQTQIGSRSKECKTAQEDLAGRATGLAWSACQPRLRRSRCTFFFSPHVV